MISFAAANDSFLFISKKVIVFGGENPEKQNSFLVDIPFFSGYNKIEIRLLFEKRKETK